MLKRKLEIVKIDTDEVYSSTDVTGQSEAYIAHMRRMKLDDIDRDVYYVRDTGAKDESART